MRNARIDMRLPDKQKARWQEEADLRKIDLSEMIRRFVEQGLDPKTQRKAVRS